MSTAPQIRETRVIKVDDEFILLAFVCSSCGHECLWRIPRDREGCPFDCPEECGAQYISWRPELEFVVASYPLPDEKPGPDHRHVWGPTGGCWCGAKQCARIGAAFPDYRCRFIAVGDDGKCELHTSDPAILVLRRSA
jgi:hypothetical protein